MPKPTAAVSERTPAPEMYATRLRAQHLVAALRKIAARRGVILHCMDPQLSRLGHTMPHDYVRG